ncbi:MAG: hypothetical protein ABSH33_20245 [Steroidobacteraceae bacterium]|jgi:hypothetical protein
MLLRQKAHIRFVKSIAIASVVSACGIQPLIAQTTTPAVGSVEAQARDIWRTAMSNNPASTEGCFHASYPSLVWESVECAVGEPRVRPTPRTSEGGASDVTGNGHDYALGATGLITAAQGQFPTVTDVKSEKGVGVAAFGGGGILGPNEYTLQLNSNANATTSVCAGHSGCTIWQQFIYSPDYITKGKAAVFIQYWLLNWGTTACPTGWQDASGSCVRNSASVVAPDLKITDLGDMALDGQAAAGGNDIVTFYNGTEAYAVTAKDNVVKLGTVWTEAEFNVVGNAGGSRADFNKGVTIYVLVEVQDGSASAPRCLANAGTTGETNNLTLGDCVAGTDNSYPAIEFVEAN